MRKFDIRIARDRLLGKPILGYHKAGDRGFVRASDTKIGVKPGAPASTSPAKA